MKRILCLITALALFTGVGFSQDLQVRSLNITSSTNALKVNGKDVTNSLSGATATLAFADSLQLDFKKGKFQSITLTDSIVFKVAKNISPGHQIDLRIVGHASVVATLGFPAAWKFVGTKPTTIAATKTAILVVRSYGTTDANIVCFYTVEP
jgi:hypothetical protein